MQLGCLLSMLLVFSFSTARGNDHLELFWNLYGAVVRGSRILHDVTEGAGAVSKAIRAIDIFLDGPPAGDTPATEPTDAISETLLSPSEVAKLTNEFNSGSDVPAFNGCGALGFHIIDDNLPVKQMTECCIAQDKCYKASCKVNKRECDSKLRSCLFSMCDQVTSTTDKFIQKTCRSAAKLLFSGTMALSFKQFNDARTSQLCDNKNKQKPKR